MNTRAIQDSAHVKEYISPLLDGELDAETQRHVREHIQGCSSCCDELDLLRAMASTCRSMDRERPEPPSSLWPAIQQELHRKEIQVVRWRLFGVGAFAGAAVVAVFMVTVQPQLMAQGWTAAVAAVGAGAAGMMQGLTTDRAGIGASTSGAMRGAGSGLRDPWLAEAEIEFRRATETYERSINKLTSLAAREESSWSPHIRMRYSHRLGELDHLIARSRQVVRMNPADSAGNDLLLAAYRKKLDFLMSTIHREPQEMPASLVSFSGGTGWGGR